MPRDDFSFGARYIRAAAEKRGWEVTLHPEGAFAGRIRMSDGATRYFVRSTYDINTVGAAHVARDKALTKFYLRRLGYPVLDGQTFFSDSLCRRIGAPRNATSAREYAQSIGFPVMVKANSGSGGEGIERVDNPADMDAAMARSFAFGDVVLIEPYVENMCDYRLLVLDGELLLAYERRPFALHGDGRSTLRHLVDDFASRAMAQRTGTPNVERVEQELLRVGRAWSDVLREGESLSLLHVANLSQGGSANEISPDRALIELALGAARDLNLRFCGVDILTDRRTSWILELNSSPTIHQFATLCDVDEERLGAIFDRILLAMVNS